MPVRGLQVLLCESGAPVDATGWIVAALLAAAWGATALVRRASRRRFVRLMRDESASVDAGGSYPLLEEVASAAIGRLRVERQQQVRALDRLGEIERILRATPIAVLALDHMQRVISLNPAAERLLGVAESPVRGRLLQECVRQPDLNRAIAAAIAAAGEHHQLVHARGGSIPRGGGRIDAIVTATPPSSVNGWLRLTEQGEGINQHYGLGPIALRTLERAFGALSLACAAVRGGRVAEPDAEMLAIAARLAETSAERYRGFVKDSPAFQAWFQQVTPIDVIERMQIGGRPLIREGLEGFGGLRAVPWVFAWTQNRMMLPGWFGAGTGLQSVIDTQGLPALRRAVREWPFLRTLIDDIEVMLARTDLDIAAHYAALQADALQADRRGADFFAEVRREYRLTHDLLLLIKEQQELLDGDRTQQRALALRNPYVDPMNLMQVDLLRRWRAGGRADRELLEALLASVNGIAQGLQNTG